MLRHRSRSSQHRGEFLVELDQRGAGAAVELLGIGAVAWDVRASSRTLREMSDPGWAYKQREKGEETGSLFELIARVSAGNLRRRATGVVLIACGLVVQTVGNVVAL